MCGGPVGSGQSYWGLIQVKMQDNAMTPQQLEDFKDSLEAFLTGTANAAVALPQGVVASLANGTIKADEDPEGSTSMVIIKRR